MSYILNKAPLNTGDTIFEIKDGILFLERTRRRHFTVEAFKEMTQQRLEYSEGFSYPIIIFGKDMIAMDKAAREYMGGEGCINKLSRAFVVEKSQGKLQLNFFIETQKQPIPVEIFDAMEPAIEWSKQFRKSV
jgi:hypothetical protein